MSTSRAPYPAALMHEVRRLYAAGWSPTQIRGLLIERGEGRVPTTQTLLSWSRPGYHASQIRGNRARHRRTAAARLDGSLAPRSTTPDALLVRVRRLRAADLSYNAITKVVEIDFGQRFTEAEIERMAANGRLPRRLRSAA